TLGARLSRKGGRLMSNRPIGLLAGWGRFPILFAEAARRAGLPVVGVGIRAEASPALAGLCSRFYWCRISALGRMIRLFQREGVEQLVMAGKIHKANWIYRPWKLFSLVPDW